MIALPRADDEERWMELRASVFAGRVMDWLAGRAGGGQMR